MATDHPPKPNRAAQLAQVLVLVAHGVLLYALFNLRFQRILYTDIPYYSGGFIAILAATILLIGLVSILSLRGDLGRLLQDHKYLWAWFLLSLGAWLGLTLLISAFAPYAPAYLMWLILFDIALLLLAFAERVNRIVWADVRRNLLAIGISIAVTLLMLELGLRFFLMSLASEEARVAYLYSVDEILEKTNRFTGYPYINYGLATNHPEHNSRGYRGIEFETPKSDGIYRIFALGGSTTYGDGVKMEEAYPAQLQTILRETYGYTHVEVVNAGVNAYSSFDSLANLAYHILDDEPDMLLIYHGVNDVRARLVDPQAYSGLNLQRGTWSPQRLTQRYSGSTLWRFMRIQLGIIRSPVDFEAFLSTSNDVLRCPFTLDSYCEPLQRDAQSVLDANPPIYLERNLRNMVAIARANGVDVVFSTWAYYIGETPFDNFMSPQHMQNGVNEQNALQLTLGAELNVPVIDFAANVPENGAFWIDGMHLTATGTHEQALEYAAFLVENNLLPPAP